jgi:coenzyme F420-reducing hydrogenase gamma subunit
VSYQLAPGMGALKGSELLEFFSQAEKKAKFVVATACGCHGFFSALKKKLHDKAEK